MILIVKPRPATQGSDRMIRGGSFFYLMPNLGSATRYNLGPAYRTITDGFRLILRKRKP